MENSARKTSSPQRVVFRDGKSFICGMCKKEHRDRLTAKNCLQNCMQELVRTQPLKLVRHHSSTGYQCQICKREYDSKEKSFECVQDCLQTMAKQLVSEYKAAGKKISIAKPVNLVMPTTFPTAISMAKAPRLVRKENLDSSSKTEPEVGDLSAGKKS